MVHCFGRRLCLKHRLPCLDYYRLFFSLEIIWKDFDMNFLKNFTLLMIMLTILVACGKTVEDADKYTSSIENIAIPDDVSIVGLGEATHGNVEFQDLRKDVFQVLVEK